MAQNSADTTSRPTSAQRLETLAARHGFIYLILISFLALIGYAYLLLFPAGLVMSIGYLMDAVPTATVNHDWEKIGAIFSIALLCGITCLHILRFRHVPTPGVPLTREQAPELYKLIESVRKSIGHRKIRQVVITDDFQLEIRQTPAVGFPLWFDHTLVIGLPLLQSVAPKHFRCELARRMSQHAQRRLRPTHHIFLARGLWQHYLRALTAQPRFGDQLLRWFFQLYTPLFAALSLPAARRDELAADSAVLHFINDNDVFETIKFMTLSNQFLATHYWPKVRKMAINDSERMLEPFAKLERLVGPALKQIDGKKWLEDLRDAAPDHESPMPDFRQRMHNIGHTKIRDIPRVATTAAGLYLKDAQSYVVPAIDNLWQTVSLPAWLENFDHRRDRIETIRALSEMSHQGRLSPTEVWRYARLAKELKGSPYLRSIRKLIRRNVTHGKAPHDAIEAAGNERLNDVF